MHALQKHSESWKVTADMEGYMDVEIQEKIIEYKARRQYLAQYYR